MWIARRRIAPYVRLTPVELSPLLSEQVSASVWLKLEALQLTGSFKLRGAANKLLRLDPEVQRRGVVTFSTGNHGLAVAYMARTLGLEATVCVSRKADPAKLTAIRRQGAKLAVYGESQDEAEAYCYWLAEQRDLTVVKPFDDPEVIAGQGTMALELLEALPGLKAVLVPVSGGGLAAGVGMVLKSVDPSIRVIGVSMEGGAAMYHSLQRGSPVALPEVDTLADSLQGGIGQGNRYTLALVRRYVDEWVLVSEEAIGQGMAFLLGEHRLVVEGAAAVGVAALLEGRLDGLMGDVAVILSGRNVDPLRYLRAVGPRLGAAG
ncbi:pyridoxal-phosphate dependent enzyme [Thermus oshimai]